MRTQIAARCYWRIDPLARALNFPLKRSSMRLYSNWSVTVFAAHTIQSFRIRCASLIPSSKLTRHMDHVGVVTTTTASVNEKTVQAITVGERGAHGRCWAVSVATMKSPPDETPVPFCAHSRILRRALD